MQPHHQTSATIVVIRVAANSGDFIRRGAQRFQHQFAGQFRFRIQRINNVLGMLGDLTQGFRAIQMLAANDKPHFIIIKNRHYRVLIESQRPGQPVPGRKLEDSVVRRSSPIADSGDKAVQSVVPVRCAVAGFSLPHWPFFAGLMGCLRALSRRRQQNRRTERTALVRGNNLQRAIQHVAAGLHNDLVFRAMPPSAITLLTAIP